MKKAFWLATTALCVTATPALADPIITPLIVSALATVGFSGASATFAATVLSGIITTAIGIGLTLIFTPRPKTPAPENGSVAVQQPTPYSIFGYGQARCAGAIMLKEESNGYLLYVAALARQAITGFAGLYLNDDLVNVPTVGTRLSGVVTAPTGITDGRYGDSAISIDTRLGAATETSYSLITAINNTVWGTNHRGDGIASLAMRCSPVKATVFSKTYPYQAPQPSPIIQFAKVYDPRDGAQSYTNPATWVYSANAALALLHFECFSPFGSKRPYATAVLPVVSFWTQAANDCDDAVALKAGGTEPRYRLGGWTTTEQERRTTRQTILQCCDGHFVERGDATIVLRVGKYAAPTVTLTDDDIVAWSVQHGIASDERVNQITARYTSPDNAYVTVETDPQFDSADLATRPGPPRTAQLDLPWVQSTGQASRLLKRDLQKQKLEDRITLTLRLTGINAVWERWVLITSNTIPLCANTVVEVHKSSISLATQTCEISVVVSGSSVDTYTAATDESAPPYVPGRAAAAALPVPASVVVVAQQTTDASGGASIILNVTFDEAMFAGSVTPLNYLVQTRLTNAGAGVPGPWTQTTFNSPSSSGGRVTVTTGAVAVGTSIDVQVFSIGSGGSQSLGSTIVTVSTSLTMTAPGPPTAFTGSAAAGTATLNCTNPNSANFAYVQFYRAPGTGAAFGASSAISSTLYGAPRGGTTVTDSPAAGAYSYFVVAFNAGGVGSTSVGPVNVTV